jgi:23S rRNA-/tRNA-specific pseudouridylate synthase
MAKPSSHAVVDSGEVPAAGGAAGDPNGFAAGEDGKWNLAEATLAAFPSRFPTLATARKAVRRGEVAVADADGARPTPRRGDFRPSPGSRLELIQRVRSNKTEVLDPYPADVPKLVVAYEDDHCAVVVKPEGVATVGASRKFEWTVERMAPYFTRPCVDTPGALARPRPVHRLDQSTGGLLVVAKTRLAATELGRAFENREPRKRYRAVLGGSLGGFFGVPLVSDVSDVSPSERHEWKVPYVIDTPLSGKPCVTEWRVVRDAPCDGRDERVTLVDMWPKTGRTHQLRRHAAETLRAPILGDARYARRDGKEAAANEDGLFLWAVELFVPVSAMPWLGPENKTPRSGSENAVGEKGPRRDVLFYDDDENKRWLRVRVDDPPKFARRLESSA